MFSISKSHSVYNVSWPSVLSLTLGNVLCTISLNRGGGAVGQSVSPASGRLGVRNPATTDEVVKTGSDSFTAKRSSIGVGVTGPRK